MVEDYVDDIIAALFVVGLKGARAPSEWTQTLEDGERLCRGVAYC